MDRIKLATVFSGIGAPEQAAKRVWETVDIVFACEIDKYARESYLANYSIDEVHFHHDITQTDFSPYRGKVDMLVGGSPCQSFSFAGNRRGFEDTRGTLFFDFARAVKECEPEWFIFENVKGIVNHDNGNTLDIVLRTFGELNYGISAFILNTKDYGVPQNRERFFVVGKRGYTTKIPPLPVKGKRLKEKLHNKLVELYNEGVVQVMSDFTISPPIPLTVNIGNILESSVDEKYHLSDEKQKQFVLSPMRLKKRHTQVNGDVALCQRARQYSNWGGDFIMESMIVERRSDVGLRFFNGATCGTLCTSDSEGNKRVLEPLIVQRPRGFNEGNGYTVVPTVSSNSWEQNNVLLESYKLRKLTPRECLRLQDFPDDFKCVVSDAQLYKQAGNSMSVNVVEVLFKAVKNFSA